MSTPATQFGDKIHVVYKVSTSQIINEIVLFYSARIETCAKHPETFCQNIIYDLQLVTELFTLLQEGTNPLKIPIFTLHSFHSLYCLRFSIVTHFSGQLAKVDMKVEIKRGIQTLWRGIW